MKRPEWQARRRKEAMCISNSSCLFYECLRCNTEMYLQFMGTSGFVILCFVTEYALIIVECLSVLCLSELFNHVCVQSALLSSRASSTTPENRNQAHSNCKDKFIWIAYAIHRSTT